ncbi:MAG: hypothetical protein M9894_00070 [Planctomycetes bacterium]|nr:hypothetical protein [Planctomycetota bacterium]
MADLYRKASDADLRFARKPLDEIDPQRIAAFKARHRAISKFYDKAIDDAFRATRTERDRHSTAQSRALEVEKKRKLGQLRAEFDAMFEPTLLEQAKKAWEEISNSTAYKVTSVGTEVHGYATTAATLAAGGVAMGLQVAAGGLLLTNPFTASLALLNELDKWIGRAIGWVQKAKKQWDADTGRISKRIAERLARSYGDSKIDGARGGGWFSAGADASTVQRQKLEKLLYHRIWGVREETIKYKIKECEVTAEAQKLLEQKKQIEAQVHAIDGQLAALQRDVANLPPGAYLVVGGKKTDVKQHHAKLKAKSDELVKKCLDLSQQIMALLNEVVDNCSRLVNKAQADVDRMVSEVVRSFAVTEAKGKFTGAHTHGAWLRTIRGAF